MGKRQYTNREWKLLSWWLATYHPRAQISMQERIGPTKPVQGITDPTPAEMAQARVRNRWVDALFIENDRPYIVEAKMKPDPGIFSQLIHYARKFRADPFWSVFARQPLGLIALVYDDDPSVAVEAPWYGVQWVVYQPNLQGFLPPQLLGTPLDTGDQLLPWDWPARLQALLNPGSFFSSG
jgi:hypothetical protein